MALGDEDLGFLDFTARAQERLGDTNGRLRRIGGVIANFAKSISRSTDDLNEAVRGGREDSASILRHIASEMDRVADVLSADVEGIANVYGGAMDDYEHALEIRAAHLTELEQRSDKKDILSELQQLVEVAAASQVQFAGMRSAIAGVPRLTKEMNVAKRQLLYVLDKLSSQIDEMIVRSEEVTRKYLGVIGRQVTKS